MPHHLGLLLWGESGSAINKVGIAPPDLARFPKHTGGLLVQDSNGNKAGLYRPTVKLIGGNSYPPPRCVARPK